MYIWKNTFGKVFVAFNPTLSILDFFSKLWDAIWNGKPEFKSQVFAGEQMVVNETGPSCLYGSRESKTIFLGGSYCQRQMMWDPCLIPRPKNEERHLGMRLVKSTRLHCYPHFQAVPGSSIWLLEVCKNRGEVLGVWMMMKGRQTGGSAWQRISTLL